MRRRAFTLLELMTAVLLGALIMLMVAGSLRAAIRAWESVQQRVGVNYNRRTVLELVKRQASSLFFREDAAELDRLSGGAGNLAGAARPNVVIRRGDTLRGRGTGNPAAATASSGFQLPPGAEWMTGHIQELNFLSTVSFLTDFPGQVAVRYYVVQGNPGEEESIADLPHSRTVSSAGFQDEEDVPAELDLSFDEGAVVDELEGNLYLYMEEKNLFLAATMQNSLNTENDPFAEIDNRAAQDAADDQALGDAAEAQGIDGQVSEIFATNSMKLIGPLRRFFIRYRKPGLSYRADQADDEESWSPSWNLDRNGKYPAAIEFNFVFEPEGDPKKTADIPTEELESVRMVIPVYHSSNLQRDHAGFEPVPVGGDDGGF